MKYIYNAWRFNRKSKYTMMPSFTLADNDEEFYTDRLNAPRHGGRD